MLALSVREALRQAAAAFGPAGTSVDLPSPATPEAVFWAVERARSGGDRVEAGPAPEPAQPAPDAPPLRPESERTRQTAEA
jgi:xanthine dehydrogenase large subunit